MTGNSNVTARNQITASSTVSIQISLAGMSMYLGKMKIKCCLCGVVE
jgi:hypothetical protein